MARRRWVILKDSDAQAELLAEIRTASIPDMDSPNESDSINVAEEDLTFTVHYAKNAAESPHNKPLDEAKSESLNQGSVSHKNTKAKTPTQQTLQLIDASENYLLYLRKHVILPAVIARQKQTPNFSYSKKPLAIEKIIAEAIKLDSVVYATRMRDARFDISIMRYIILEVCIDAAKSAPRASQSEVFKNKYREFKTYFSLSAPIENAVDQQANTTFQKAIGEMKLTKIKKSLPPKL